MPASLCRCPGLHKLYDSVSDVLQVPPHHIALDGLHDGTTVGILVSGLAKAHRLQEQLESGQYAGLEDLATASGVDRTQAGRMLRLTSLAPGIVERILDGEEPAGISLAKLRNRLPVVGEGQEWR